MSRKFAAEQLLLKTYLTKMSENNSSQTIKNPVIPKLKDKLLELITVDPKNLIEVARLFSVKYPSDWKIIRIHFQEDDLNIPPKRSLSYLNVVLEKLKARNYVNSDGENIFFKTWFLGSESFTDVEETLINLPKRIKRTLEQDALYKQISLDQLVLEAIQFNLGYRLYSFLMPYDILKVLVVNFFGTNAFSVDQLMPFLKLYGLHTLVDLTLESYCVVSCQENTMDKFLIRLNDKEFKIKS